MTAAIIFQAQVVAIVLILAAIPRAAGETGWGQWGILAFLGGLLLVLALIAWPAWIGCAQVL